MTEEERNELRLASFLEAFPMMKPTSGQVRMAAGMIENTFSYAAGGVATGKTAGCVIAALAYAWHLAEFTDHGRIAFVHRNPKALLEELRKLAQLAPEIMVSKNDWSVFVQRDDLRVTIEVHRPFEEQQHIGRAYHGVIFDEIERIEPIFVRALIGDPWRRGGNIGRMLEKEFYRVLMTSSAPLPLAIAQYVNYIKL